MNNLLRMKAHQQNPDGSWSEAQPLPGTRLYRIESWLRKRGHKRMAAVLAWWDELQL
jgi:hypothetical protein